MALVLGDRIQETTTTTGTGAVSLGGAVTGYLPFSTLGGGAQTYYCITNGTDWEVGYGTWLNATNGLTRQTVLASSNSNALVNFPAGPKNVFVTYPAGKSVYLAFNGAFRLPQWTTATRPTGPTISDMGFNTTLGYPEWYDGNQWWAVADIPSYSTDYLVVGGGGGGGQQGGGGGAGGLLTGTGFVFTRGQTYNVSVGGGGAANTSGGSSTFASITAAGGGRGGWAAGTVNGASGGSGGGAAVSATAGTGGSGNTPTTSPSQGNSGGSNGPSAGYGGGGGGGAGAAGANGTATLGGNGGAGVSSSITGTAVTYAGGGGGGLFVAGTAGTGGAGGGGNGASLANNAVAGVQNFGGGGGGTGSASPTAGVGGSGVVILKYSQSLTCNLGTGLTGNTVPSGSFKVTTITSGSGTVYWS